MAVKHTRRQIRTAAVQFLFSHSFRKDTSDEKEMSMEQCLEHFWQIINEDANAKIVKATIPPLIHLSKGRIKPSAELQERATTLIHLLEAKALEAASSDKSADPDAKRLLQLLKTNIKSEATWQPLIHKLEIFHQQKNPSIEELSRTLEELFALNSSLASQAANILEQLNLVKSAQALGEPVAARLRKLALVCERIKPLESPRDHEPRQTTAQLLAIYKELDDFRDPTNKLIQTVIQHLGAIDDKLAPLIQRYDPQRLDPVIRAILRLGTAEITYCIDIPAAVAINEAMEITRSFCDDDAVKFVNGILDKVAKTTQSISTS